MVIWSRKFPCYSIPFKCTGLCGPIVEQAASLLLHSIRTGLRSRAAPLQTKLWACFMPPDFIRRHDSEDRQFYWSYYSVFDKNWNWSFLNQNGGFLFCKIRSHKRLKTFCKSFYLQIAVVTGCVLAGEIIVFALFLLVITLFCINIIKICLITWLLRFYKEMGPSLFNKECRLQFCTGDEVM